MTPGLSREICKLCYHVNAVGFAVPDQVWFAVVPDHLGTSVVCLPCFTRLGDEKGIEWDAEIAFFPVSMASHLKGEAPSTPVAVPARIETGRMGFVWWVEALPAGGAGESSRIRKALKALGINSWEQLLATSEEEFLECRNFGECAVQSLRKRLAELGLSIPMHKRRAAK